MAYLLVITGNCPKSLETIFKALQINKKMNGQYGISANYNTAGIIYNGQGDSSKALNYFFKSRAVAENPKK